MFATTAIALATTAFSGAAPGLQLLKANLTREGWQPMPLGTYCLSARTAGYFTARAVPCNPSDPSQQWTQSADGSLTNQVGVAAGSGQGGMKLFVNFNLLLTETDDFSHSWHSGFTPNNLTKTLEIDDGGSTFCLYAQSGANDLYYTVGFMVVLVMVEAPGTKVAVSCGDGNSVWYFEPI